METHDDASIDKHVRTYLAVFGSLLVLTLLTVWVSTLEHSVAIGVAIALFIATVKAGLVASYFMHLLSERKVIYGVMALTVFFFLAVLLLPVLTAANGIGS